MRRRRSWLGIVLLIVTLAGCSTAQGGETPQRTATAAAGTSSPTRTVPPDNASPRLAWSQFSNDGAIQIWEAATDSSPRLLATMPASLGTCQLVSAGLTMLAPDDRHALVGLGQQCGGLIDDPGPLAIVDTSSGHFSTVPLPADTTVLPQVRSYGWIDNNTVVALPYNATSSAYVYTVGSATATRLDGLLSPLEGVVRGSTLFYLEERSSAGSIQLLLHRYDLAARRVVPGSVDLGGYRTCSECPSMVISPGWDVSPDGSHIAYQFTTLQSSSGSDTSQILYARADGSGASQIARYLATNNMVHIRFAPDGARVAITAAYPSPAVITACVNSPGTKDDPCFVSYTPDANSLAAWAPDGRSFVAATQDASYGQPSVQSGHLVRYILGTGTGHSIITGGYAPWSLP